jgi:hypothetical protein
MKYNGSQVEGHNWSNCSKPKKYNISTKNNKKNLVYHITRYNLDTNSDIASKAKIYYDVDIRIRMFKWILDSGIFSHIYPMSIVFLNIKPLHIVVQIRNRTRVVLIIIGTTQLII